MVLQTWRRLVFWCSVLVVVFFLQLLLVTSIYLSLCLRGYCNIATLQTPPDHFISKPLWLWIEVKLCHCPYPGHRLLLTFSTGWDPCKVILNQGWTMLSLFKMMSAVEHRDGWWCRPSDSVVGSFDSVSKAVSLLKSQVAQMSRGSLHELSGAVTTGSCDLQLSSPSWGSSSKGSRQISSSWPTHVHMSGLSPCL